MIIQQNHPEIALKMMVSELTLHQTLSRYDDLSECNLEKLKDLYFTHCPRLDDKRLRKVLMATGGLIETLVASDADITGSFKLKKKKISYDHGYYI